MADLKALWVAGDNAICGVAFGDQAANKAGSHIASANK